MAIEIRELLIRTFVGNQQDTTKDKDQGKSDDKQEDKANVLDILADVSKLLQQAQER